MRKCLNADVFLLDFTEIWVSIQEAHFSASWALFK